MPLCKDLISTEMNSPLANKGRRKAPNIKK